jgi:phosphate starvation-inducible PhoH-like protein
MPPVARKATKKASRRKQRKTARKDPPELPQQVDVKPLNREQASALRLIESNVICFLTGPAGTGKTHLACGHAVRRVADGNAERIVITRPVVEAGENLGFLPGTLQEKVSPYLTPIYDAMDKAAGKSGKRRDQLNASLVIAPLAYMRGRTFENAVVIVDEAQNCTIDQLRLVISRLGKDSQIILSGDISQSDLKSRDRGLAKVIRQVSSIKGVGCYQFTPAAIVRHPILTEVLEAMS